MAIFRKKTKNFVAVSKSVETITAKLHETVGELEGHAEDQLQQAAVQRAIAESAWNAHDEHNAEHALARTVAENIKKLLGG